jgi:hypothetical protein
MSIVTVHGPQTFGVAGAGGGGGGMTVTNTGGTVTADPANGLRFTFAGAGDRAAADYDWSFSGGAGAAAQPNIKNGTVTFTDAGPKVITLTLGTTAGTTPAGGTYTFNVTAVSGPRAVQEGSSPEESQEPHEAATSPEEAYYDPSSHTVDEVLAYASANPDEVEEIYEAEQDGKNRTTLLDKLEAMIPFDPADHTVTEVIGYIEENPDQLEDVLAAEQTGKNRSTLISQLEDMRTA